MADQQAKRSAGPSRRAVLAGGAAAAGFSSSATARTAPAQAGTASGDGVIKVGFTPSPRTRPIKCGEVTIPGIPIAVTEASPSQIFLRQLRDAEFDVSEMSISSLLIAKSHGDERFIPLPIFTSRYFFHSLVIVRRAAGIRTPADLRGKRVGVPEYQMTGALWTRGVLADEFGVRPEQMDWFIERQPGQSHAGAVGFKPPANVRTHQLPPDKNIGSMMQAGELDAAVMYFPVPVASATERSTADLLHDPRFATLFPDPHAEEVRYYRKTGVFPINHCAVIKRDVHRRRPELRAAALSLFDRANDLADRQRMEAVEYHYQVGLIDAATRQRLAERVVRYGVAANRVTLDKLARYSFDQGFTPQLVDMDAFFAAP